MIYHRIKHFSEHPLHEVCTPKENTNPYWLGPIIHPFGQFIRLSTEPQNHPSIHPQKCIGSYYVLVWLNPGEKRRSLPSESSQPLMERETEKQADNPRWWVLIQWEGCAHYYGSWRDICNSLSKHGRRGHLCQALKGKEGGTKVL